MPRPTALSCARLLTPATSSGGRLDPAVAYMQGRLKIDGAYERVLFGLRPLLDGEAFSDFAAEVRSLTGAD